jgi:glycosyltransferase involved in cell wall biosynthesis
VVELWPSCGRGSILLGSRAAMATAPSVFPPGIATGVHLEPEVATGRITIVIPAHNEEQAIQKVLASLLAGLPDAVSEVIVVDDGSSDRTGELATEAGVRVLRHPTNRGYGASLKAGIRVAKTEYVLTMDADGQHRVEDVQGLCQAVRDTGERVDCVIGHRTQLLHSALWRMPGKWFLTILARILTGKRIGDLNSGLRVMRRDVILRYVHLCPSGFSFSTTSTFALASRGYRMQFVPITVERRSGKSTVSVKTGFQVILLVLRLASLFNPLRVFLPLSMLFIVGGVLWTIPYLLQDQGITVASMLAIVTGVILFALGLICDQVAQLRLERFE